MKSQKTTYRTIIILLGSLITWVSHLHAQTSKDFLLIQKHCGDCHYKEGPAPFPLEKPEDVIGKEKSMAYVIEHHIMPPWKADTAYRHFVNERLIPAEEKQAILNWLKNDELHSSAKSSFTSLSRTRNEKGDLTVEMPYNYTIQKNANDTVVSFVTSYCLDDDQLVNAFNFFPGNNRIVHHANIKVFDDTRTPPGYKWGFDNIDSIAQCNLVYYDGWVPGASPKSWPGNFGFKLPRRGVVIFQIHYSPVPQEEHDRSKIVLKFGHGDHYRYMEAVNIGTGGVAEPYPDLILEPGSVEKYYVETEVSKDLTYLYLNPHMHYLGVNMLAYAVTPEHDTIKLVKVNDWDFHWQEFYKPLHPIKIPRCSIIHIEALYDNTADNPNNRFSPPKTIFEGSRSTDEMMSLIILSTDYEPGDENYDLTKSNNFLNQP